MRGLRGETAQHEGASGQVPGGPVRGGQSRDLLGRPLLGIGEGKVPDSRSGGMSRLRNLDDVGRRDKEEPGIQCDVILENCF